MEKQALILFTRLPLPGTVKTRLMPQLDGVACAELQWALLADLAPVLREVPGSLFVFYTPDDRPQDLQRLRDLLGPARYLQQQGADLGQRMQDAFALLFSQGYANCLLLGSDIPLISRADIGAALDLQQQYDVVLGPSTDGGYWLVGLKQPCPALFWQQSYSHDQVLAQAQAICVAEGLSVGLAETKRDIDTWGDLSYFGQIVTQQSSLALYEIVQDLFVKGG